MAEDRSLDLGQMTVAACRSLLGQDFVRHNEAGPDVTLRLVAAESAGPNLVGDRPFRLIFSGPTDPQLTQGMHDLDHPDHPVNGLFLVPLGPRDGAFQYEAVFS